MSANAEKWDIVYIGCLASICILGYWILSFLQRDVSYTKNATDLLLFTENSQTYFSKKMYMFLKTCLPWIGEWSDDYTTQNEGTACCVPISHSSKDTNHPMINGNVRS